MGNTIQKEAIKQPKAFICDDKLSEWFKSQLDVDIKCYIQEIRTDEKPSICETCNALNYGKETMLLLFPNQRYLPVSNGDCIHKLN
jgi:hypothetical protein